MKNTAIESKAFQRAALRSERIRILVLIVVLVVLLIYVAAQAILRPLAEGEWVRVLEAVLLLLLMVAYETAMLLRLGRVIQRDEQLSRRAWLLNVIIESSFPTLGIFLATFSGLGPYVALSAPVTYIYFFFNILSVLRLSPMLSCASGVVAAAGYAVATAFTYWKFPQPPEVTYDLGTYVSYGFLILMAGLIAGGVAHQVRGHVIVALQEARELERIQREMNIARTIQRSLLPEQPPQLPGFEVAGWNKPAHDTGGDYYDWLLLPDGRAIFSIADVSGHGLGPALMVSVCRAYFRALALKDNTLEESVWRVNHLLSYDLPPASFITAAVGILDPGVRHMSIFSAGHGPLLMYRAEAAEIEEIPVDALPLGLMSDESCTRLARSIHFAQGDMLILITDGFYEWFNPRKEQFGIERLEQFISDHGTMSPDELITSLYHEVLAFAEGSEQLDDLTAVAIKYSGKP